MLTSGTPSTPLSYTGILNVTLSANASYPSIPVTSSDASVEASDVVAAASVEAVSVFVSVLVDALVSLLLPQPANVPIAIAPVNASAIVF